MVHFEWDPQKELINIAKHGIDFRTAAKAFSDPHRLILVDQKHGSDEERFICFGDVDGHILTVRFVYREDKIRIFGAGYWRDGRKFYEKEKKI